MSCTTHRYATFAADEIRAAIAADPKIANPLSMWARRLVGEAHVAGAARRRRAPGAGRARRRAGAADDDGVPELLKRITAAHTARMAAVGLNN